MNVAASKVDKVIRVVLRKLANKTIQNLPSVGTISEIRLEARHLADIEDLEVGLVMRQNRPEEALGNCIHRDGTTKYHKKYQNFQITLQKLDPQELWGLHKRQQQTQMLWCMHTRTESGNWSMQCPALMTTIRRVCSQVGKGQQCHSSETSYKQSDKTFNLMSSRTGKQLLMKSRRACVSLVNSSVRCIPSLTLPKNATYIENIIGRSNQDDEDCKQSIPPSRF